jgi:hypothetical protein
MGGVHPLRILPTAIERPTHIALTISSRGRYRIERPATARWGKMRATPEGRSPAPRAAGRASSNVFSSAGEHTEHTQGHRRIQASGATWRSAPAFPPAIPVRDKLPFKVIVERSTQAQSFARSAAEAAWRGDRITLGSQLQQVRPSAIGAIQILGHRYGDEVQTRGEAAK